VVTVTGRNFVVSQTECKFAGTNSAASTVDSTSLMRCLSPALSVGTVSLELSNNNQDFTLLKTTFEYYSTFVSPFVFGCLSDRSSCSPQRRPRLLRSFLRRDLSLAGRW
jgi:hypothetical protein